MPMLTVRLPADMEKRLSRLSQRTGRPKVYYAKKAIGEFLEEQEIHHAKAVLSNADTHKTFFELVGREHLPADFTQYIESLEPSTSAFIVLPAAVFNS